MDLVAASLLVGQCFTPEIKNAIFLPIANKIGNLFSMLWDQAFNGQLTYYQNSQENLRKIEDFAKSIEEGLNQIDEENLQEPKMCVAGPSFDAVKYFIDEDRCKEMFKNLIVASCDKKYNEEIHPSFVEILKQLSPVDADFLNTICNKDKLVGLSLLKENIDYPLIECDLIYKYGVEVISQSVSNLSRLGIISIQSFYDTLTSITVDDPDDNDYSFSISYQNYKESTDDTELMKYLRKSDFKVLNTNSCFTKLGFDFIKVCVK